MARQHILVVDDDPKSLQVLEISLKKAGYLVTVAQNGLDGLDKAKTSVPELIISDVKMPKMNGYQFCKRIKEDAKLKGVPFIFLSSQRSVDDKIKGLELGVDDYLTKPIYIKELLTRVRLLLQKREKESLESVGAERQFSGALSDMGVVDLLQTLEIGRKIGVLYLSGPDDQNGLIYFQDGRVIDAIQGPLKGERAVYRMLTWNEGSFKIDFKPIQREPSVEGSTQGLIMEGMRRLDEWERLAEQLPPLDTVLIIDPQELLIQYPDKFPTKAGQILQLFDGRRTILQVVDESGLDDLPALNVISKLYFQGLLKEFDRDAQAPTLVAAPYPATAPAVPPSSGPPTRGANPTEVAAAASNMFGDVGETSSVNVRDLLARSGLEAQVAAPPTVSPSNGSPELSFEDLTRAVDTAPRGAETEKQEKKERKSRKVLSPDEPKLVKVRWWRSRALAWAAGIVGGLALVSLLLAGIFAGLNRMGIRPLGALFNKVPDAGKLEARLARGARDDLETLLRELNAMSPAVQAEPRVAAAKARALIALSAIDGSTQDRMVSIDQALRTVPTQGQNDPSVQLAWAEYEVLRGIYEEARRRAAVFAGSSLPEVAARAAYISGLADLREGRSIGNAIGSLNAAAKIQGNHLDVRVALAEALLRVSNYQDARTQAEKAVSISPQALRPQLLLARACTALGDLGCAEAAWAKAVQVAPADSEATLGQVEFLWRERRRPDEATSKLNALVADGKFTGPARARAHFLLGEIVRAEGGEDAAREHYLRVKAIDADYPGLASRLAETRPEPRIARERDPRESGREALQKGNFRAAAKLLEEATRKYPSDDAVFSDLGLAYLQIDDSENARRALERALTLNGRNITALRWLGQIYSSLPGKQPMAAKMFRAFLKLAPDHPDAPLVQALLRRVE